MFRIDMLLENLKEKKNILFISKIIIKFNVIV